MKDVFLIYDSEDSGHHFEYLHHLMQYSSVFSKNIAFVFVVHKNVAKRLKGILCQEGAQVVSIRDEFNLDKYVQLGGIRRSYKETICLQHYVRVVNPKYVFLANLNAIIFYRAFQLNPSIPKQIVVSGIHFHPYFRMESKGISDRLKKTFKKWALLLAIRRGAFTNVFVLNDDFVVSRLNMMVGSNVFRVLSDPIPFSPTKFDDYIGIRRLLFFGYINKRKGVLSFLSALEDLELDLGKSIEVRIAGVISDDIKQDLFSMVDRIIRSNKAISFEIKEGFVEHAVLQEYVRSSSMIIAPYLKSEGSSGLLGWSAAFGKPILATRHGLVGELVARYKLGITVDPFSVESISKGLKLFLSNGFEQDKMLRKQYIYKNSPESFAMTIFRSVLKNTTHENC